VARQLKKLGVEYRTERVQRRRSQRPEILEITGLSYVPVLVDGDEVINDSHRIREYLDWAYGDEADGTVGRIHESGEGISTMGADE
jgi:glutaredoxin 3